MSMINTGDVNPLIDKDKGKAERIEIQRQATLLQADGLQNAIFNSVNFSSIATDAKGVIQIFNLGAERMLGYSANELVDQATPADISDPQEVLARAKALSLELDTQIKPGFEALVFKASGGIKDIYELTYICKDGSQFPAIVSVTALRDKLGEIIGYLFVGTDNSVRKQFEQALIKTMAETEKANLTKSDFLYHMRHELRTPLNAILGFAQLLESGKPEPTPSQKRSVDQILQSGWHLLELMNEILDLALIESGKLSLLLEPVSLAEVMQECEKIIEPQANKRGIQIEFPHFDQACFINTERTRLKQIVINLLSNAIKYNSANGSVYVSYSNTSPTRVRIAFKSTGDGLNQGGFKLEVQPYADRTLTVP
ncbi:PAS domain-containing sensor histidine kinase [Polaromonas vacuolata]